MKCFLFVILPALIAACEEWPISRIKTMHICSDDLMFEVQRDTGRSLYITTRSPDLKAIACYAKKENKMLKIINVPMFNTSEVKEICDYFIRRIVDLKKTN